MKWILLLNMVVVIAGVMDIRRDASNATTTAHGQTVSTADAGQTKTG